MPSKKKKWNSTDYYRENPEARRVKAIKDKEINARPEQRKKRSELTTKRREDAKKGLDIEGKDYDHGSGRYVSPKKNRGKKNGTKGDKRARG